MMALFAWLESTTIAQTVGQSLLWTAWLSAFHAIGFTLVMSGGMVSNLRAAGAVLSGQPLESITRPASAVLLAGLVVSLTTGFLLFAPRASSAATSGIFELKMALILTATCHQLAFAYSIGRGRLEIGAARLAGTLGILLWLALAVSACWFILFE
jgi:hypothetical protein